MKSTAGEQSVNRWLIAVERWLHSEHAGNAMNLKFIAAP